MSLSLKRSKMGDLNSSIRKSRITKKNQQVTKEVSGGRNCYYEDGINNRNKFYNAPVCQDRSYDEYNQNDQVVASFGAKNIEINNNFKKKLKEKKTKKLLLPEEKQWLDLIYDVEIDPSQKIASIKKNGIHGIQQNNNTTHNLLLDLLKKKKFEFKPSRWIKKEEDLIDFMTIAKFREIYGPYEPESNNIVVVNNKESICNKYPLRHACKKTVTTNNIAVGQKTVNSNNITTKIKLRLNIKHITDLNEYFGDFTEKNYTDQVIEMALRQKKIIENERERTGLYTNTNGKTCKLDEIVNSWKYCIIDSMIGENSFIMIFKRNNDTGNLDVIKIYSAFKNFSLNNMNKEHKIDTGVCVWLENNPTVYIID